MAYGSCKDCEDIQRGGKAPRCLVCIYHDASIFNKPKIADELGNNNLDDKIAAFKLFESYIDNSKVKSIVNYGTTNNLDSKFAGIYAANAESWEAKGINCQEHFGFIKQDIDAENERVSKRTTWYFTFPCDRSLRDKYVRVFGTNIESREIIENAYPDKDYKQWSIEEWNTPNKYTRRKPCDCYIEWTI